MRTLFHISDVHFGPPHVPAVSAGVLEFLAERKPDLVVISGDLTQRAKPGQFRQARAFVDQIPVPSVVVPGNHDVPLYRFWERALSPFGAYRAHFSPQLEPVYGDEELWVVGVNTAYNWTFTGGRITLRRLQELEKLLCEAPKGAAKVVVAHHHLIPPPKFGSQSVLVNAAEAADLFSSMGVDLVLSGHHHQSYIGSTEEYYPQGRNPVLILHSGTTTSNRGRGRERNTNTGYWIRIDDASIQISLYRWHPLAGRFTEQSRHWYPRPHLSSYSLEKLSLRQEQ